MAKKRNEEINDNIILFFVLRVERLVMGKTIIKLGGASNHMKLGRLFINEGRNE